MLPPGLRLLLEALDRFAELAATTATARAGLMARARPALRSSDLVAPLLEELGRLEDEFSRAALKVNESVRRALGKV